VVWLVLWLVVMPILELWVFVQAADSFGFWTSLLVLVGLSLFGVWLALREGRRVWRRFNEALNEGRSPSKELVDGMLLLLAGVLLILPGFVSDAVGLALLVPPVRALVRPVLVRRSVRRGRGWGRVQVVTATYDRDGLRTTAYDSGHPGSGAIDVSGRELGGPSDAG
jgi:UPF0716 protein FxsA